MRRHGSFPDLAIAVAVVSGAAGMVGVYLDTAWHRTVGRDSFFILPHVFIYCGGLGVLGAALGSVTHATLGRAADFGGPILRLWRLQLPLGFAVTALGISVITAAAPVDAWWHDTFGKDVLIWSPPHLQLHLGAGIAAIGLLFAVAAQRGRGALAGAWLWRGAMLAVLVDLVHRGHFILAHYTMLDHARTPDLYPFLVALLVPVVLVAAARAVGPWAPTLACLLFLGVTWLIDVMLRAIEFERYTLTPILALPVAVLSLVFWGAERSRDGRGRARAWLAAVAGVGFVLAFVTIETAWMRWVVGRPWPTERVLAALPRVLVTGALSAWVGWVRGGADDGARRYPLRHGGERHVGGSRAVPARTPAPPRRRAVCLAGRRLGVPTSEPEPIRLLHRAPSAWPRAHDASRAPGHLQGPVRSSGRSGSARDARGDRGRRLRA